MSTSAADRRARTDVDQRGRPTSADRRRPARPTGDVTTTRDGIRAAERRCKRIAGRFAFPRREKPHGV
ncbi:hypothetical protein BRC83_01340 [Halobacteriales archaeon QS_1_68_17]|nr:MAG: hypothetical protein BRC83_01340 [Halobacteriales archaeon QS_1_68_17]